MELEKIKSASNKTRLTTLVLVTFSSVMLLSNVAAANAQETTVKVENLAVETTVSQVVSEEIGIANSTAVESETVSEMTGSKVIVPEVTASEELIFEETSTLVEESTTVESGMAPLSTDSTKELTQTSEEVSVETMVGETNTDVTEISTEDISHVELTSIGANQTVNQIETPHLNTPIPMAEVKTVKNGFVESENKYYVDGVIVKNTWTQDEKTGEWYYSNVNGLVEQTVTQNAYQINGVVQKDKHISINGTSYYYDLKGKLLKNNLAYSESMMAWFKSGVDGILNYEVTPWGHYVDGVQQFDVLAKVNDLEFYFEPKEWNGTLAFNKWSYSPSKESWYHSNLKGEVEQYVTPNGYTINGVAQKDKHISINGWMSYYFEVDGKMSRNKTSRSDSMNAWFKSAPNGVLTYEVTPWGHYVNGVQQFDTVAQINDKEYYFEPKEWNGALAINKWSYSPTKESWYFANNTGIINKKVTPTAYTIDGVAQKDKHVSINGWMSYYFEMDGKMSRNKTSRSDSMNAWFKSAPNGVLTYEVTPWGHYVNGVQQFDVITKVNNQAYYFEPKQWNGVMAAGKWSYSPSTNLWYQTNNKGIVTRKDKYGATLPTKVVLDKGQWTMYMLYQDNWESGCWLRTAASGINSAGGNQSPFTLIKHITRTDDPRTGMLSHPSIVNNWNLGGAYSAMWPEALVPVVQKFVPNAKDLTGATFADIKRELANGNTVQVYYSWAWPNIRLNSGNGTFLASKDYHSVLLTGYDSTGFYYQEHWGTPRNNHFSYSKLEWQFNAYGKKAISYRKQSILP